MESVADPAAIGDLWPASISSANSEPEWEEEEGRKWKDHGHSGSKIISLTGKARWRVGSQSLLYGIRRKLLSR